MIYYKKKSWIKKIKSKILNFDFKPDFNNFFAPLKVLFFSFFFLGLVLYLAFIFLMPKYINNNNISDFINNYILKETKLEFEAQNLKMQPNYKLDVNLQADLIKLKYSNNKDVLVLKKPNIDISTFALFGKNLDLNKVKVETIAFNTVFLKNHKYDFSYYISSQKKESKIKLRKIHLYSNEFLFNLYDENLRKNYSIISSKLKLILDGENKPIKINTSGKILAEKTNISDFNFSFEFKLKKKNTGEFRRKILALDYNPFVYADKLAFKSSMDINLKSYSFQEKNHLDGEINLKDYSFVLDNKRLPVNNLLMKFKGDKIFINSNFNLVKNQFVKVDVIASYSKNKYIDAKLKSNEINLSDFIKIAGGYGKILNSKINYDDFNLDGKMHADLHLKSNFKEINSKGQLLIQEANLSHKKTGLELKNINSNINLANNKINILNTSALIENSKFYLAGLIDEKTNLNLKIHSEEINIAKVINFLNNFPLAKEISPFLDNNTFKTGNIKIDAQVLGVLKNPIIKTKTKLNNLKMYSKKADANFNFENILITANPENNKIKNASVDVLGFNLVHKNYNAKIPAFKLNIAENDIELIKTKGEIFNIGFNIEGVIKNFKNKNREASFILISDVLKNTGLIFIKDVNAKINSNITLKSNKVLINKLELINSLSSEKLAYILGGLSLNENDISFDNLKLFVPNKITLISLKNNTEFDVNGSLNLIGTNIKPNYNGKFNLYNLKALNDKLNITDAIMQINNSNIYINVLKGILYDSEFNLIAQAKYLKNAFEINDLEFNADYINISNIAKKIKQENSKANNFPLIINNLKGNIGTFETDSIVINSLKFAGELKNSILNISDFSAIMYDGNISGKVSFNLLNNETTMQILLKNINVRSLSQEIKEFSIAASGKLSALVDAKINGFDFNSILNTFDGYIKFNINDGELSQLAKFERFLQAGNILSQSILKLSLNSAISLISKQNTGEFKTIEGTVKISGTKANIQYIKTQGVNMSLHLTGKYSLLSKEANLLVLGRIPLTTVNILGNIGKFTLNDSVEKMGNETKTIIKTITISPLEKLLSQNVSPLELEKIPSLAYQQKDAKTREFIVNIFGDIRNVSSIKSFKWAVAE